MSTNITHAIFGGEHDNHSVVIGIESSDCVTVIARGFGFFPASVKATVPLTEWGTPKTWEAEMATQNRLARRARNDKAWQVALEYLEANRYAVKDFIAYRMNRDAHGLPTEGQTETVDAARAIGTDCG